MAARSLRKERLRALITNPWTGRALKVPNARLTSMVGQLAKKFAAHEEKRDGKTA